MSYILLILFTIVLFLALCITRSEHRIYRRIERIINLVYPVILFKDLFNLFLGFNSPQLAAEQGPGLALWFKPIDLGELLRIKNWKAELTTTELEAMVSKCTTVAQLSTVFLALLNPKLPDFYMIQWSLCWLTAGLTIISGLHYIYIGLNILQDASGNSQAQK